MASIENEFTKRNCKLIGLSIDSVEDHNLWKKDIEDVPKYLCELSVNCR